MNMTCGDDARRTSALTNKRANAPNFCAKLPFLRNLLQPRLMFYFNTNKPQRFLFLQNTSGIRKPQVISGEGGGGAAPPAPYP